MKRLCKGLVAACTFAALVSTAVAQSATAYSSSAIGVIKKTALAQKQILISVPLDQESDDGQGFIFSSIPAIANLPNGTVANFFDVENQRWIGQAKSRGSWGAQANRRIKSGESFFIKNNQSTNIELVISGEVPSDASLSQGLAGGAMTLIANPYPIPVVFTNFSFASTLPNGSVVTFYDVENQRWIGQAKSRNSWGAQKDRVVQPGEGFFIKPYDNDVVWTEVRPYTWPN